MTITLDDKIAARLADLAARRSQSPEDTAYDLLDDALDEANGPAPPLPEWVRPTSPPAWVDEIKPLNPPTDGTNGLHRVFGALQTPETDEELTRLLDEDN